MSLSSTSMQLGPSHRRSSDAADTKSDGSSDVMDVSSLEADLDPVAPGTEEADPRSHKGEAKIGIYPSVSITPVTSLLSSSTTQHSNSITSNSYPNINLERRPGIEIIPFGGKDPSSAIPSSLTITPVGSSNKSKEKNKYKEFRLSGDGHGSSSGSDAEKKERKRRREDEKSPSSGDKPSKMVCVNSTLMGPPSVLKADASPKRSSSSQGSMSASISPMASPSRSSSKSSTPSSSPKHLSPGGKPSMSALSMSALKCKFSLQINLAVIC